MPGRFDNLNVNENEDPFALSKEESEERRKQNDTISIEPRQENEYVLVPGNPQGLSSELTPNVPNIDSIIYTSQFPVGIHGVFNPDIVNGIFFEPKDKDNNFINGIVTIKILDGMGRSFDTIFREESIIFNLYNSSQYRPSLFRWNKVFIAQPGDQLQILFNSKHIISPQNTNLSLRLIMIRQQI